MPELTVTRKIYNLFLYLSLIALTVVPKLVPIILIGLLVSGIVDRSFLGKEGWKELPIWVRISVLLPALFFLLNLVGMVHTEDLEQGWKEIIRKIMLIILPVFILLKGLEKNALKTAMGSFLAGLLLSMILNNIHSWMDYLETSEVHAFLGGRSVYNMHLGYYALYLIIGLGFSLDRLLEATVRNRKALLLYSILGTYILANLFMTGSKMGFITVIMLLFIGMLVQLFRGKALKPVMLLFLGVAIVLGALLTQTSLLRDRFSRMTISTPIDPESTESTQARRMTWDCSSDIISLDPWTGIGTGDINQELMLCYEEKGYKGPLSKKLGPHSQYFASGLAVGVLGMLTLLAMFLIPFIRALSLHHFLGALFFLSFLLTCSTESILERAVGIHLYSLLLPLMLLKMMKDKSISGDASNHLE